ncbi:hypothetical protein G5I_00536 [Acromyrmex echinatior]|uniref:Uncharacterized protein n=1 Tax=Acromyrmex echinatior TaxID=103372 RepID=F4W545_ACREC|nr:hypothetical protein G5I_00536 [Acromyrmex echinatior]
MLRYRQGFAMSNSDALLIAVPVPRYDFARCRISRNSGSASKTISPSQQRGALMTRASRNFNSQCGASRPTHSISQCTRTSDTTANASPNKIRHDVMSFRYPMSTQIDRERDVSRKGLVIPLIKTRINNHRLGNNPSSTRENPVREWEKVYDLLATSPSLRITQVFYSPLEIQVTLLNPMGDIESCTGAEKYLDPPHNALGRITSTK